MATGSRYCKSRLAIRNDKIVWAFTSPITRDALLAVFVDVGTEDLLVYVFTSTRSYFDTYLILSIVNIEDVKSCESRGGEISRGHRGQVSCPIIARTKFRDETHLTSFFLT